MDVVFGKCGRECLSGPGNTVLLKCSKAEIFREERGRGTEKGERQASIRGVLQAAHSCRSTERERMIQRCIGLDGREERPACGCFIKGTQKSHKMPQFSRFLNMRHLFLPSLVTEGAHCQDFEVLK
jgi:hypothetical protein